MKLLFVLLFIPFTIFAQSQNNEKLTNSSIIQLKKAGFDKNVIIKKINISVCAFDLSTNGLIELKKEGVDDEVVEAMLSGNVKTQSKHSGNVEDTIQYSKTSSNANASSDTTYVKVTYNDVECSRAAASAQTYDQNNANIFGLRVNKGMYVNLLFQFQINVSTTVKIVMRKMKFSGSKLEPEKLVLTKVSEYNSNDLFVKDDVDENWRNYFYVTYQRVGQIEGNPNFPRKVGFSRSYVAITSIDKNGRTFDGEFNIDAETNDGTPLKIKGSFRKLSYDGGNVTDPLYQR